MARLLVVDDEPNVLYSLDKRLRSDTLQIITARTARQGIELVQQQHPDAVILDLRLPDMSGLDAFDQIRALDPRLPVILITAYTTRAWRSIASLAGRPPCRMFTRRSAGSRPRT
jgi:CheY-like chemotaxis protein